MKDKIEKAFYQRNTDVTVSFNFKAVVALVERGDFDVSCEHYTYPESYLSDEWIELHYSVPHLRDGSRKHMAGKLIAARYLEETGHDVARSKIEDENVDYDWRYDCFELSLSGLNTDVVCKCNGLRTVVEIGDTSPEYLLRVFGYQRPSSLEEIPPIRHQDRAIEKFVVNPYPASLKGDTELVIFEPKDLADVDRSNLREMSESLDE